jgi:AcrR family transcriptional regulator
MPSVISDTDENPVVPRRARLLQERSRSTRRELVRTALRLWSTEDYDKVTVGRICAEAGVSKGLFYFYFPQKESILIELGWETAEKLSTTMSGRPDEEMEPSIRAFAAGFASLVSETPPTIVERTIIELYRSSDVMDTLKDGRRSIPTMLHTILSDAVCRSEISDDLDLEFWALAMASLMVEGARQWARKPMPGYSLEEVISSRLLALAAGLVHAPIRKTRAQTPPARVRTDKRSPRTRGQRTS